VLITVIKVAADLTAKAVTNQLANEGDGRGLLARDGVLLPVECYLRVR
jgi:hypothetical protein